MMEHEAFRLMVGIVLAWGVGTMAYMYYKSMEQRDSRPVDRETYERMGHKAYGTKDV